MNEHRLGRFILPHWDMKNWESDLLPIMGNFVIVECRPRFDLHATEYLAYSPLFEVTEDFEAAPEYEIEIAKFPDAPAVISAKRKKGPEPRWKCVCGVEIYDRHDDCPMCGSIKGQVENVVATDDVKEVPALPWWKRLVNWFKIP